MTVEPGIDLTTEELLCLSALADLAVPVGLDTESFDDAPEAYREHALLLAERTLRARHLVTEGADGTVEVAPAITSMMEVASAPGLLGVASVQRDQVVDTRFFSARPELGVEHRGIGPSIFRFTPFMTRDFLARIIRFTDLRPADVPDLEPVEVPLDTLEQATLQADGGDRLAAVALLQQVGVLELPARAIAAALAGKHGTVTVTLLTRPDPDQVVGGMLVWLDGGLKGNWILERTDRVDGSESGDVRPMVLLRPASAAAVVAELLSYMPDGLSTDA